MWVTFQAIAIKLFINFFKNVSWPYLEEHYDNSFENVRQTLNPGCKSFNWNFVGEILKLTTVFHPKRILRQPLLLCSRIQRINKTFENCGHIIEIVRVVSSVFRLNCSPDHRRSVSEFLMESARLISGRNWISHTKFSPNHILKLCLFALSVERKGFKPYSGFK